MPCHLWPVTKEDSHVHCRVVAAPHVKTCHARRQLKQAIRVGESAIFSQFQNCLEPMTIIVLCLMSFPIFVYNGGDERKEMTLL